jgi:hypothetical protein
LRTSVFHSQLSQAPGIFLVATASLALGIAINATVFSWVERILLRFLPGVFNPGEIVSLNTVAPNGELLDSSYLDFRDFRDQSKKLAGVVAFKQRPLYLGKAPEIERVGPRWSRATSSMC